MPIFLNNQLLSIREKFPDGTYAFKLTPDVTGGEAILRWHYGGEEECMALYYITEHLRTHGAERIVLEMPYTPNARLDRVYSTSDIFTLKIFAKFINSLGFHKVVVFDPHSAVSTALIDRVEIRMPRQHIAAAIADIGDPDLALFYPDEGAMKRYSAMSDLPYGFGIKRRDWKTGSIVGFEIAHPENVKDRNVLIIDDICSRGGTFRRAAEALMASGAKGIYLYCSHCEHTIFAGELLNMECIKHVYTTNSIYRECSGRITAFDWRSA